MFLYSFNVLDRAPSKYLLVIGSRARANFGHRVVHCRMCLVYRTTLYFIILYCIKIY